MKVVAGPTLKPLIKTSLERALNPKSSARRAKTVEIKSLSSFSCTFASPPLHSLTEPKHFFAVPPSTIAE